MDKTRALAQTVADAENQQFASARRPLTVVTHSLPAVNGRAQRLADLLADLVRPSQGIVRIYAFDPLTSAFRERRIFVVLEIPRISALAASKHIFRSNVSLLLLSAAMAVCSIW